MMTDSANILFRLLRAALGDETEVSLPSDVDWQRVVDLAFDQGVAALVVDGLQKSLELRGESLERGILESEELEDLRYELFGETLACEEDYREHLAKVQELMAFYRSEGIPTMVLKGYGLGLNYPIPAHRPTGDVDIYQFGRWEEADALSAAKLGVTVDNSHHHHSVFAYKGLTVENHYDMVNVHSHRSSADVERTLKRYAAVGETVEGGVICRQPISMRSL